MFTKLITLAVILVGANCRYLIVDTMAPKYIIDHRTHRICRIEQNDLEDIYSEQDFESVKPVYLTRHRRQAHVEMNTNPDGSANVMGKFPIAGNDKNNLIAIGGISGAKDGGFKAGSAGLALDNVNGHGLSVTGTHLPNVGNQLTGAGKVNMFHNDNHDLTANAFATRTFPSNPAIPNFNTVGGSMDYMYKNGHGLSLTGTHDANVGNQLTGAGKLNMFHNDNHDLTANAFATRTFPSNPAIPNFNTVGGSMDYMYKNKVGGSLGMSHSDLFKQTDYSAMGKLNLFQDRTSSLDFSAGATKSMSPYIPHSSWQPSAGLSFTKYFKTRL